MTLKCENCGYEAAGRLCPACGEEAPRWAGFCPHCGAALAAAKEGGRAFDLADRRLCPDGNCIGILDAEGRCVVCGLSAPRA